MATIEGVDYTNPGGPGWGKTLAAAGKHFACRYGGPGGSWKELTAAEVADLTGNGVAIVANAEGTADGLKGGYPAGHAWAQDAGEFFAALGMPKGRPVYLSADFDATAGDFDELDAAFRGARDGLAPFGFEVGAYAEYDVLEHLYGGGVVRWFWQTYAWSGGRIWRPDRLHIYQYRNGVSVAGVDCDLDRAYRQDYGQWGVDMAFMDDKDFAALAYRVEALVSGRETVIGGPTKGEKVMAWNKVADMLAVDPEFLAAVKKQVAVGDVVVPDRPLGDDDKPAIVAAVKQALAEGVGHA